MNDEHPDHYGEADWSDRGDIARAGMFKRTRDSVLLGFWNDRPVYAKGQGGLVTVAGARSGKLTSQIAWNVCGPNAYQSHSVIVDPKGEIASISRNLMWQQKQAVYWNPNGLHDLPQHRFNPIDYLVRGSPSLVDDAQMFAKDALPPSGSANGRFFEDAARTFLSAILVQLADSEGVATLPRLYDLISGIELPTDEWFAFEYEMIHESEHKFVQRVGSTIANKRLSEQLGSTGDGGGTKSILSELFNVISALNSPLIRESFSPPYDFSFSALCNQNLPVHNVYLIAPAENLDGWSPVIKAMFNSAMIWKARNPDALPQLWIIDEAAQFGKFPNITRMFTYGAGINIRPWVFVQSAKQLDKIDSDGKEIILSSAAYQTYFAIRHHNSAEEVSRLLGNETRMYEDSAAREEARHSARQALIKLMSGEGSHDDILEYVHQKRKLNTKKAVSRRLMTPTEVMRRLEGHLIITGDDMAYPAYADRKDYWREKSMMGYFHPNAARPDPSDSVEAIGAWFKRRRAVITDDVPIAFAQFAQYQDGDWTYIDGYMPPIPREAPFSVFKGDYPEPELVSYIKPERPIDLSATHDFSDDPELTVEF